MTVCYELVSSTNQHYPMTTALPDDLMYLAETDDFMLFTSEALLYLDLYKFKKSFVLILTILSIFT